MIDALRYVREDAVALAAVTEHSPEAAVPACPGWTVAEVGAHVGRVHRLFTAVVRAGSTERPRLEGSAPRGPALPGWVREGAEALAGALESAPEDLAVWNWTGTPQPPAWVRRRMLHETAVHRWDAESAVHRHGAVTIPADVARDGVDEFVEVISRHRTDPWDGEGVSVRLVAIDGTRHWLLRTRPGARGVEVDGLDGEAGTEVHASASDLLLLLWRRLPLEAVGVRGRSRCARAVPRLDAAVRQGPGQNRRSSSDSRPRSQS